MLRRVHRKSKMFKGIQCESHVAFFFNELFCASSSLIIRVIIRFYFTAKVYNKIYTRGLFDNQSKQKGGLTNTCHKGVWSCEFCCYFAPLFRGEALSFQHTMLKELWALQRFSSL